MYAATIYLSFDPSVAAKVAELLSQDLARRAAAMNGFCEGHWLEPIDLRSMGFVLFDSEANAEAATAPGQWSAPGVKVVHVVIAKVATSSAG